MYSREGERRDQLKIQSISMVKSYNMMILLTLQNVKQ